MTEPIESNSAPPSDLVVVSDLHLGEGFIPSLGAYSPMEDFFHDDAFVRFLNHLENKYKEDPSKLKLVLNGDIFDFLTMTKVPDARKAAELGFDVSAGEKMYGLNPTPAKSVYKLDCIVAGHEPFFRSLAHFIAIGHKVIVVRGNHDLELYYEEVQAKLREHLSSLPGGPTIEELRERLVFYQWFYLEPHRLYIEHGNQYEASTSIRYPLLPIVPNRKGNKNESILDYPLGSQFVRYFYNRVHHIEPYTPKLISFEQYLEFVRSYNLLDLVKIARDHYPFFIAALRQQTITSHSRYSARADSQQEESFRAFENATQPKNLYRELNKIKEHPMNASAMALAKEMSKPLLRKIFWVGIGGFLVLYCWMLVLNLIQDRTQIVENVFGRTILMLIFVVLTGAALLWIGNYIGQRFRRRTDITVITCAQRAEQIGRIAQVPLVLMGHTHIVDIRKSADGKTTYANSGTWVAVANPWKKLVPDARRMTFLFVHGTEVQICRWNDPANRIEPVPLFFLENNRRTER